MQMRIALLALALTSAATWWSGSGDALSLGMIQGSGLQIFYSKQTLEKLTHKMALRLARSER